MSLKIILLSLVVVGGILAEDVDAGIRCRKRCRPRRCRSVPCCPSDGSRSEGGTVIDDLIDQINDLNEKNRQQDDRINALESGAGT